MSLIIKPCHVNQIDKLQAFIHDHWKKDHVLSKREDLLRWQYRDPHNAQQLSVLIAEEEGSLHAILGYIPVPVTLKGQKVEGAMIALWVTAKSSPHRSAGLSLLLELHRRYPKWIAVWQLLPHAERILEKMNYEICKPVPRYVYRVNSQAYTTLLHHFQEDESHDNFMDFPVSKSEHEFLPFEKLNPNEWDIMFRDYYSKNSLGLWKDSDYFQWRYFTHPQYQYKSICLKSNKDPTQIGLIIYRMVPLESLGIHVLRMVECLGDDELICDCIFHLREKHDQNLAYIEYYSTSLHQKKKLLSIGFKEDAHLKGPYPNLFSPLVKESHEMTFAIHSDYSKQMLSELNLYSTISDGDQDRPNA